MKKFNKGFAHFLLLVIVLTVFMVGGIWMWRNGMLDIAVEGPTPTPAPAKPVELGGPTPTPSVTTYTNTEFGYKISFPSNLELFPAGYYPTEKEEARAPGISVQQPDDGYDDPLFKLYVMNRDNWKYQMSNPNAVARFYLRENKESNMFVDVVQEIEPTTFAEEEAYTFSIVSSGFEAGWEGFVGEEGRIKFIFFEHDNHYFTLAYYDQEPYNQIIDSFEFTELTCDEGEELQQCKQGTCCCPIGATCD